MKYLLLLSFCSFLSNTFAKDFSYEGSIILSFSESKKVEYPYNWSVLTKIKNELAIEVEKQCQDNFELAKNKWAEFARENDLPESYLTLILENGYFNGHPSASTFCIEKQTELGSMADCTAVIHCKIKAKSLSTDLFVTNTEIKKNSLTHFSFSRKKIRAQVTQFKEECQKTKDEMDMNSSILGRNTLLDESVRSSVHELKRYFYLCDNEVLLLKKRLQ